MGYAQTLSYFQKIKSMQFNSVCRLKTGGITGVATQLGRRMSSLSPERPTHLAQDEGALDRFVETTHLLGYGDVLCV